MPRETMLSIRKKHDHRTEGLVFVVPHSGAQVLTEPVRANGLKDDLIVACENATVFDAGNNDVSAFEQVSALIKQSMGLFPLQPEDQHLWGTVRLPKTNGIAELILPFLSREDMEAVSPILSDVVGDSLVLCGEIFTHRLTLELSRATKWRRLERMVRPAHGSSPPALW